MEVLKKNYVHVWPMKAFLVALVSACDSGQRAQALQEEAAEEIWTKLGPVFQLSVIGTNYRLPLLSIFTDFKPLAPELSLVKVVDLAKQKAHRRGLNPILPCLHSSISKPESLTCCSAYARLIQQTDWDTLLFHLAAPVFYWLLTECSIFRTVGQNGPLAQITGVPLSKLVKSTTFSQRKAEVKRKLPSQPRSKEPRLETLAPATIYSQNTASLYVREPAIAPGQAAGKRRRRGKKKKLPILSLNHPMIKPLFRLSNGKKAPRAYNGSQLFEHDKILQKTSKTFKSPLQWPEHSPFLISSNTSTGLLQTILITKVGSDWCFDKVRLHDPYHPFTKKLTKLKDLLQLLADNHRNTKFKSFYYSALAQANEKARKKMSVANLTDSKKLPKPALHSTLKPSSSFTKLENHFRTEGLVSVKTVYCFTRACIRQVIPEALLGGKRNVERFLKNVRLFIRAGKDRDFMLDRFMQGMTSCQHWLEEFKGVLSIQQCLLAKVVWWLMRDFVMVLLPLYFYITPSSRPNRNFLVWYPQNVWRSRQHQALRKLCAKNLVRSTIPASTPNKKVAHVQFLPKTGTKFRPISKFKQIRSTKKAPELIESKQFLKVINSRYPEIVPSKNSSWTYNKWRQFVVNLKSNGLDHVPLYYVVLDIKDAYGSMQHEKLLEVFKKSIADMPRTITGHLQGQGFVPTHTVAKVLQLGRIFHVVESGLIPVGQNEISLARGLQTEAILVDTKIVKNWNLENFTKSVMSLMDNSFLQLDTGRAYQVVQGIPQGWPLSEALCNLYYGEMAQQYLQEPLCDHNGVFFRGVDDFLYVTTDRGKAFRFLETMSRGIEEYGCIVDPKKAKINFTEAGVEQARWESQANFCGLTFDLSCNSGVRPYLTGYVGADIVERMSLRSPAKPGIVLQRRVANFAKLKLSLLFIDREINSRETVIQNVYTNFLMASFHFHAIVKHLFCFPRRQQNSTFLMNQIESCYWLVLKQLMGSRQRWHIKVPVNEQEVRWLCYKAFHRKLIRTKSWYGELLKCLETKLAKLETKMGRSKFIYLLKLIGRSLPVPFTKMRRIVEL